LDAAIQCYVPLVLLDWQQLSCSEYRTHARRWLPLATGECPSSEKRECARVPFTERKEIRFSDREPLHASLDLRDPIDSTARK